MTYAGALPFIACAVMLYSGINNVGFIGSVSEMTAIYALIIISFLAGIHLGTLLLYNTNTPKPLFIISNLFAAGAWFSLLITKSSSAVIILVCAFGYLLFVDYMLRREKFISSSYFNTRIIVTAISAGSLLLVSSTS